jgi:hypothetical protein
MTGYDFIECAKRLGLVLMGRVEPSVAQVRSVAAEVVYTVNQLPDVAIRTVYDAVTKEPVPADFYELINRLPPTPRSYIPSRANGRGR